MDLLTSHNFAVRESALHTVVRLGLVWDNWVSIKVQGGLTPIIKQLVLSEVKDAVSLAYTMVKFVNGIFLGVVSGQIGLRRL